MGAGDHVDHRPEGENWTYTCRLPPVRPAPDARRPPSVLGVGPGEFVRGRPVDRRQPGHDLAGSQVRSAAPSPRRHRSAGVRPAAAARAPAATRNSVTVQAPQRQAMWSNASPAQRRYRGRETTGRSLGCWIATVPTAPPAAGLATSAPSKACRQRRCSSGYRTLANAYRAIPRTALTARYRSASGCSAPSASGNLKQAPTPAQHLRSTFGNGSPSSSDAAGSATATRNQTRDPAVSSSSRISRSTRRARSEYPSSRPSGGYR